MAQVLSRARPRPSILQPSRYLSSERPILIDNIFINSLNFNISSGNLMSKISDHMPNFTILNLNIDKQISNNIIKRHMTGFNENEFLYDLKKIDFSFVNDSVSTLEDKYSLFHEKYLSVVDKHAPPPKKAIKKANKTQS